MGEKKYETLIKAIELVNIELQNLTCDKNNDLPSEKRSNLQVGLNNKIVEQLYEDLEFIAHIHFDVTVFHSAEEIEAHDEKINDDDVLFNIEFILESTYKINIPEMNHTLEDYEDELVSFSERNVPINTWPYAREIISSITTRMGFPPLFIPTNKNVSPY